MPADTDTDSAPVADRRVLVRREPPPTPTGRPGEVDAVLDPDHEIGGVVVDAELVGSPNGPSDPSAHDDPSALAALVEDWLLGYSTPATRMSYGDALGLDRGWVRGLDRTPTPSAPPTGRRVPRPPTRAGKYRDLAWFRWCDHHEVHPVTAAGIDVKRWQADMVTAGVPKSTRAHRLAVVSELYRYLVEHDAATANPAGFDRKGLGLGAAGDTSSTVVLTAHQVDRLLAAAGSARRGVSPLMALRSVAVVAVFTLGLRAAELAGLRRGDLHLTRGRRALRVTGKGDKTRIVFLSRLAADAVDAYLTERDRWTRTTVLALPGQVSAHHTPLIATRDDRHLDPRDLWSLIRRIAHAAGPELADVADRMGPHVLRHFYVTAAAEGGADMTHVQADVGHASVDTTHRVYNQATRHPDRSAVDIVEAALLDARANRSEDDVHEQVHEAWRALESDDSVDQIIGVQHLHQLTDRHPALDRDITARLTAVLNRPNLHPRIAHALTALHRQLTAAGADHRPTPPRR